MTNKINDEVSHMFVIAEKHGFVVFDKNDFTERLQKTINAAMSEFFTIKPDLTKITEKLAVALIALNAHVEQTTDMVEGFDNGTVDPVIYDSFLKEHFTGDTMQARQIAAEQALAEYGEMIK